MAVDIFLGGKRVLSIPGGLFVQLDSSQRELTRRTGKYIDAFSTTTVEPEHAQIWLTQLKSLLPTLQTQSKVHEACAQLGALLEMAVESRQTLLFEGD